ncbi:hypothetical protein PG985_012934 [Apiospora marii]|uniref:uncharacterized protein n=1 Tax=Apiospora marii TaxID=335849 RepID=UPI00312F7875
MGDEKPAGRAARQLPFDLSVYDNVQDYFTAASCNYSLQRAEKNRKTIVAKGTSRIANLVQDMSFEVRQEVVDTRKLQFDEAKNASTRLRDLGCSQPEIDQVHDYLMRRLNTAALYDNITQVVNVFQAKIKSLLDDFAAQDVKPDAAKPAASSSGTSVPTASVTSTNVPQPKIAIQGDPKTVTSSPGSSAAIFPFTAATTTPATACKPAQVTDTTSNKLLVGESKPMSSRSPSQAATSNMFVVSPAVSSNPPQPATSNIFSASPAASSNPPQPATSNIFGAPKPSTSNMFGAPKPSTSNIFGAPQPSKSNIFSAPQPATSNIFGASPAASTNPPQPSMFTHQFTKTSAPSGSPSQPAAPSLFGTEPPASSNNPAQPTPSGVTSTTESLKPSANAPVTQSTKPIASVPQPTIPPQSATEIKKRSNSPEAGADSNTKRPRLDVSQ